MRNNCLRDIPDPIANLRPLAAARRQFHMHLLQDTAAMPIMVEKQSGSGCGATMTSFPAIM
jgi:hypothetical protein